MINKNDIVYLPDAHATPGHSNRRAKLLNAFIRDVRPGIFISAGDIGDFESLLQKEKGKLTLEGKRYTKDCEATSEFMEYTFHRTDSQMDRIITLGNHEWRVNDIGIRNPELKGVFDTVTDTGMDTFFRHVVPFKEVIDVKGFACSHYWVSGVQGRPISGPNAARNIMGSIHQSSLSGHSHLVSVADAATNTGRRMLSIVGGCFTHPLFIGDWNRDTARLWWNGIVWLRGVKNGYPEGYSFITQKELERIYGKEIKNEKTKKPE